MHNNIIGSCSKERPTPIMDQEDILSGIRQLKQQRTLQPGAPHDGSRRRYNTLTAETNCYLSSLKRKLFSWILTDGESMESYYSRFYKLMNELTRNNLQVSPMQVNVQFLQQLQPEWSRFVTVVKQRQEIDTVSYHKLFDVLKQFQNEVNDIRSERLARSANPLALLAAAQPYSDNYYQAPIPQRSNAPSYKQSSSARTSASTRHKGKEIAKPVTPQSESVSEEDCNTPKNQDNAAEW
ncbi:hypothetical protein Tco_1484238 [Tanacetum coccineum]